MLSNPWTQVLLGYLVWYLLSRAALVFYDTLMDKMHFTGEWDQDTDELIRHYSSRGEGTGWFFVPIVGEGSPLLMGALMVLLWGVMMACYVPMYLGGRVRRWYTNRKEAALAIKREAEAREAAIRAEQNKKLSLTPIV